MITALAVLGLLIFLACYTGTFYIPVPDTLFSLGFGACGVILALILILRLAGAC